MKFIPGNYYKTRAGSKARFVGETIYCEKRAKLIFEIIQDENKFSFVRFYYIDGLFSPIENELDIVSEWEDEPKKIERIVNIYYSPEKIPNVEIFSQFASKINDIIDAVNKLQEK